MIVRVEASELGTDARFIVTSLTGRGKHLYEKVYCARGAAENLIKDTKLTTRSDKTACSRWQANQFRLFLHMGAYWLLHSLRLAAPKRSRWRGATFATIRSVFVKIAVRVEELKRSIRLAFPRHLPHADALAIVTQRLEPPAALENLVVSRMLLLLAPALQPLQGHGRVGGVGNGCLAAGPHDQALLGQPPQDLPDRRPAGAQPARQLAHRRQHLPGAKSLHLPGDPLLQLAQRRLFPAGAPSRRSPMSAWDARSPRLAALPRATS